MHVRTSLATATAAALLLIAPVAVVAATPAQHHWTLDINLASVHTEAWARRSLNQINPGAGITYDWNRTWAFMGGEYLNSYRAPTWYAAAVWTPLHLGRTGHWRVDAGIAAGLASGYAHASYATYRWAPDRAAASGWRLVTTQHSYMRNPVSPLMAAGIVRVVTPWRGVGLNLLWVPNMGPRSSGFVGFQLSVPLDTQ